MYHKLIFCGNLGQNPELRYTAQGTPVCNFSVASNRRWTDNEGSMQEETTWFRISAWGKLGETCNQYLEKGRLVLVEGRLTPDKETGGPRIWEDKNGTAMAGYEVTAQEVRFLPGRPAEDNGLTHDEVEADVR
jgi:single-strand DNA-binding protein